ncbi:hypothetical protein [Aureibaculum marinum]|uniref:hypothetical protein n=1 Tax=Aureibaculum marinum TaxID=2487930 RepID=UPI001939AAF0|nr:hypothetical protein [Aureibaculum marinum]
MNLFALIIQQVDIEQKITDAPDSRYEIGVFIGTYLPFVVLVVIAYFMYHSAKKKNN